MISLSAAAAGHEVLFIESPFDVRALATRAGRRTWLDGLGTRTIEVQPRIRVRSQATLVPGHRSDLAQRLDTWRLRRGLRAPPGPGDPVLVATQPWQWPAVKAVPARSRVFDCADDWRALIPRRAHAFDAMYRQIALEADAVILASTYLASAFSGAPVTVVRNGASEELLRAPVTERPAELRMVYAGTLSERFDAPFISAVVGHLTDWTLELFGECRYAGRGSSPDGELQRLLSAHPGRVTWHGPVGRERLSEALDRGRVLIAAHRAAQVVGQDSMKLYDYVARDRPIVSTPGALGERSTVEAVSVVEAATPVAFAEAVARAERPAPGVSADRRGWVLEHRWEDRWPEWARAALGREESGGVGRR
ncbi:MAG: glycosyltransferase [Actinomycetota bacterium]|nr:glycosyltransferase [Actinomycetota bacterium]